MKNWEKPITLEECYGDVYKMWRSRRPVRERELVFTGDGMEMIRETSMSLRCSILQVCTIPMHPLKFCESLSQLCVGSESGYLVSTKIRSLKKYGHTFKDIFQRFMIRNIKDAFISGDRVLYT